MDMDLKVNRLAFGLGAEVTGLDLRHSLNDTTIAAIREVWLENLVLVIPGQDITMQQHVAFSARFGHLELHPQKHYRHPEFPEIFEVSNRVINGKKSDSADAGRRWHSDGAFNLRPPTGSFLYCEERPPVGGDTWFTNMYMAFEHLSDTMKQIVLQLQVVNDLGSTIEMRLRDPSKVADHLKDNPPVVQPMVRTHPETGRKALYLNETVTRQVYGMTIGESESLLRFLFAHSIRPEFTFRHRWQKGDIVLWDNRCTMHMAPADYDRSYVRHMRRTTLQGEPLGFVEPQS
jgi:taurine dioxygenase